MRYRLFDLEEDLELVFADDLFLRICRSWEESMST